MGQKTTSLIMVVLLILAFLIVSGCGGETTSEITPESTHEPAPASESPPTGTVPAPEPTATKPAPEPTSGSVQGNIISAETQQPLAGAAIILGKVTGESECALQSELSASADANGNFEIAEVPAGSYVIFYDPSGEAKASWQEINGRMISYGLIGKSPMNPQSCITKELHETLGGGGAVAVTAQKLTVNFTDGLMTSLKGKLTITSKKYGLTIDFNDGKPLTLEVKAGETSDLLIKALSTEVTP